MVLAFSTGVDSFLNPSELGPLYPFVGLEWLWVVIAFVLWILWHVGQIRGETRENREATEMYEQIGLDRAMYHGGSALVATDEEWEYARQTGLKSSMPLRAGVPPATSAAPPPGSAPPPPPGAEPPPGAPPPAR